MNYLNIYNNLINKRKNNILIKSKDVYIEKHHIIPKCMGGKNTLDNLVYLTPREHYMAHLLLYKIYCHTKYRNSLYNAYTVMCYCNNDYENRNIKFNSKLYEKVRINYLNSEQFKIAKEESSRRAKERWNNLSDEEKERHKSIAKKYAIYGKNGFSGRRHSKETIELIRKKAIKRSLNGQNPMSGKIWIFNKQTKEIKIFPKEGKIPDGWIKGTKEKYMKCPNHPTRQFMWIHKNNINKYVKRNSFEEYNKLGWIKGRTSFNHF